MIHSQSKIYIWPAAYLGRAEPGPNGVGIKFLPTHQANLIVCNITFKGKLPVKMIVYFVEGNYPMIPAVTWKLWNVKTTPRYCCMVWWLLPTVTLSSVVAIILGKYLDTQGNPCDEYHKQYCLKKLRKQSKLMPMVFSLRQVKLWSFIIHLNFSFD